MGSSVTVAAAGSGLPLRPAPTGRPGSAPRCRPPGSPRWAGTAGGPRRRPRRFPERARCSAGSCPGGRIEGLELREELALPAGPLEEGPRRVISSDRHAFFTRLLNRASSRNGSRSESFREKGMRVALSRKALSRFARAASGILGQGIEAGQIVVRAPLVGFARSRFRDSVAGGLLHDSSLPAPVPPFPCRNGRRRRRWCRAASPEDAAALRWDGGDRPPGGRCSGRCTPRSLPFPGPPRAPPTAVPGSLPAACPAASAFTRRSARGSPAVASNVDASACTTSFPVRMFPWAV